MQCIVPPIIRAKPNDWAILISKFYNMPTTQLINNSKVYPINNKNSLKF